MINYIKKDITTVEAPALIVHGVNGQGKMASGVAKALYTKWHKVKEQYLESCKYSTPMDSLGCSERVFVEEGIVVVNGCTQLYYGYDNKKYAQLWAVLTVIIAAARHCQELGINSLYAPRIGCGLGGLDWDTEVEPLFKTLELCFPELNIYICDLPEQEKTND